VQRFADDVRAGTTFWRAGGPSFSLTGGGVSMGGASLASLLSAPIEFYTPEVLPGPPAPNGARFELYDSETQAQAAAGGPQVPYLVEFTGPIGGLTPGTPVEMRGVEVGRVRDVRLRYVPQTASLETPVTIDIDPRKLELPVSDNMTATDLQTEMNGVMARLVAKGMRATLNTSLVLPGASGISLDFVARPGTARLGIESNPPLIPAAQHTSGVQGALASLNEIAARVRALPIEEIASNLRSATARIDTLVHDPALSDSIQRLDRSLADVEKVAATSRENIGPLVTSLRNAAASAEAAAKNAQQLLGSSQYQGYDLGNLVKELTQAAESVKALATYLEEHPDSLLKGRGK
jgi:paraquat-inducible protein B